MPDFTVIEGGGKGRPPEDFEALAAQAALRMLAVEVLRAMVRGNDSNGRVDGCLAKFNDHLRKSHTSQFEIISKDRTVQASLRVTAEGCCDDNAAAGRRSGRKNELFAAIEGFNRWHDRPTRR
jgi:hypothetical protein